MRIDFHKDFQKSYLRLNPKQRDKVNRVIEIFKNNPRESILRNHPLRGKLEGKRAISVTGDLRIVFKEYENYVSVLVLNIGTHSQLYNM